jgi:hypothetical protein
MPLSKRIWEVSLRVKITNVTILIVYVSSKSNDENIKDQFYDMIENTFENVIQNDVKIIIGTRMLK